MSPAESREPGMRWYGGLGADHGQKRELGGVTITRGDLTSPGLTRRSQLVPDANRSDRRVRVPFPELSGTIVTKVFSPVSSIRRTIQSRGILLSDSRPEFAM